MDQARDEKTDDFGLGRRAIVVASGLAGAVGVIAAAAASHSEVSRNLSAIATICLAHGPALLATGLAGKGRLLMTGAALLGSGTFVFSVDLAIREWLGHGFFPGAAPIGGTAMITGWAFVIVGGLRFTYRPRNR